jgi:hypothetical protein
VIRASTSDQLVKDTFSFQMDYLYHIMERYIHTIGRPVPFVSTVLPGHSDVTSLTVLEEVQASSPREPEQDADDTDKGADSTNYVFKKYGFWASFPRTMPTVTLSRNRLRYAAKTVFPVWSDRAIFKLMCTLTYIHSRIRTFIHMLTHTNTNTYTLIHTHIVQHTQDDGAYIRRISQLQ